jgi:hypothetical protein
MMGRREIALFFTLSVMLTVSAHLEAEEILVSSPSQLQSEIRRLTPGTTLLLAPGTYTGGIYLENISGTDAAPIVIRGIDPNNPPVFSGGGQALHLADCSYVTLSNLVVYDSRVQVFVNVGPGVAPQTFIFRHNAWRDLDAARKPSLPASEIDGRYQVELQQGRTSLTEGKVRLKDERLRTIGADGYARPK